LPSRFERNYYEKQHLLEAVCTIYPEWFILNYRRKIRRIWSSFYRRVCNWTIEKWEGPLDYWIITAGPEEERGINGAIARTQDISASAPIITLNRPRNAILAWVTDAGGKVIHEKRAIPGMGYHAYCKDPEGTVFGVMKNELSAH
jgi:predicted enzyme related to lactoylglutathione lyase